MIQQTMRKLLLFLLVLDVGQRILAHPSPKSSTNMNGAYLLSNPNLNAQRQFSTEYETYGDVEYFDVYSPPISSRYAEVYWTMMNPVPLDDELVKKFAGKTMAIVGYESDQVMKTDNGDVSIPITWAYNHHFEAYLSGASSEMRQVDSKDVEHFPGMNNHGAPTKWHTFTTEADDALTSDIPASQWFSEGNGGEFRKSYHGYPHGFAQLIESPQSFHMEPMQIDTKNRFYNGSGFKPGALPACSAAPPNAKYSGLLECPCATRIPKVIQITYATETSGSCDTAVMNDTQCFDAAVQLGIKDAQNKTVTDEKLPTGCSVVHGSDKTVTVYYNDKQTAEKCGGGNQWTGKLNMDDALINFMLELDGSSSMVKITMTGPSDKWFSVAFGAPNFNMADKPYSIVVDGAGKLTERKLGEHAAGTVLATSISVVSNTVQDGKRTVVVSRPFKGATNDHYTFNPSGSSSIPCLGASGNTTDFEYHGPKTRGGAALNLATVDSATCICNTGVKGTINGVEFHKNCLPEPGGDLLQQKNPTCFVDKYQGGLACCHHEIVLLDKEQEQPTDVMTYHMKFRFWYQTYEPATESKPASHQNLVRLYWQTEALAGEYDIPKCDKGTPVDECVHEITAHWKVSDMLHECPERKEPSCTGNSTGYDGINLIYAGGHCHAPTCLSMELYNADTGKLLCRHDPVYGKSDEIFDEEGYIAIPPCLWGPEEQGLIPPTYLSFDTNLMSIKRNNNTNAHYGEMASWQMRGILVKNENGN